MNWWHGISKRKSLLNVLWSAIAAAIAAAAAFLIFGPSEATRTALIATVVAVVAVGAVLLVWQYLAWHHEQRLKAREKTLIFVSSGGTCRDPMAKAILIRLLEGKQPTPRVVVRAAGLSPPSDKRGASLAARKAIQAMYGDDLLKDHQPEELTEDLARNADLILTMDRALLGQLRKKLPEAASKAYVLKEYLGSSGDVDDPFSHHDASDLPTLQLYRERAEEIRKLLTDNLERLLDVLK